MAAKAEMFLRERKLDDALAASKAAIAAAETPSAPVQMVLGRIHLARMELSDAVAAFNEAIRLNPRFVEAHLELARTYLVMGRIDESIAASQEALKLQPANPEAHLVVARASLAKGDAGTAEKSLKLLSASNPKSAAVQAQLGYLEMLRKNPCGGAGGVRARAAARSEPAGCAPGPRHSRHSCRQAGGGARTGGTASQGRTEKRRAAD